MSVRKGDRGEGKLQVLNKARELKKYAKEQSGEYAQGTARESPTSWIANAARGDTYHEQRKMIKFYNDMEESYNEKRQP